MRKGLTVMHLMGVYLTGQELLSARMALVQPLTFASDRVSDTGQRMQSVPTGSRISEMFKVVYIAR